ncbi:MAG: PA14 domain-containing protein, partial [Actinomycetes bacterium]
GVLDYRPSNTASKGLPAGWVLQMDTAASRWDSLVVNGDASVTLSEVVGFDVTFAKKANGLYSAVLGSGQSWPSGAPADLVKNEDGTFTVTDAGGTVTTFAQPSGATASRPTAVWNNAAPTIQQAWTDGQLTSLTDPVSQRSITFTYAPSPNCPRPVDGFAPTPDGDLCLVTEWDGTLVGVNYVQAGSTTQIGRLITGLGGGEAASSTDLGWDGSARLAKIREPFASAVVAAKVVDGLGEQDTRAMTTVTYDAAGRVATVTKPAGLVAGSTQTAAQQAQITAEFTYAKGLFTAKVQGLQTPTGYVQQTTLSPRTYQPLSERDQNGRQVDLTYDQGNGLANGWTIPSTGLKSKTVFDAAGQPIEELGPTQGSLDSPSTPETKISYDRDAAGNPLQGLLATYWSNGTFEGAPAGASMGPVLPNASGAPSQLAYNWTSNPVTGSGPWAARLTGAYSAPAAGSYTFTSGTTARVWVGSQACQPTCRVDLDAPGRISLRLDVSSPTGTPAGVNLKVAAPGSTGSVVIPVTSLRPAIGMVTAESVRTQLSPGAPVQELTSRNTYDPNSGKLSTTTSPGGSRTSLTYQAYDPNQGLFGRPTSR